MARWNRAVRALSLPAGSAVLDLGCAFGFGTRMLVGRYRAYGHDLDGSYIERARRSVPGASFTDGPADSVPYPDATFDGILLLDVLEHVPDEGAVVAEIARLVKPRGQLVVSVPNAGRLAGWDSLNVYQRVVGASGPPPTDDPSWPRSPLHRHYSLEDLRRIMGDGFELTSAKYTGIGLAEPVNLALLLLVRWPRWTRRLYSHLQYIYFGVYLAEDMLSTGSWGYHLMATFTRR